MPEESALGVLFFRHSAQKSFDNRQVNYARFAQSDEKIGGASAALSLCGIALIKLPERCRQIQTGFCTAEIDGYSGFIWQNRYGMVYHPQSVNRAIERIVRDYNEEETERAAKEKCQPILLPDFSAHVLRHYLCAVLP